MVSRVTCKVCGQEMDNDPGAFYHLIKHKKQQAHTRYLEAKMISDAANAALTGKETPEERYAVYELELKARNLYEAYIDAGDCGD